jgi:hypothetical protein
MFLDNLEFKENTTLGTGAFFTGLNNIHTDHGNTF